MAVVLKQIGSFEYLVDTAKPCDVFFRSEDLISLGKEDLTILDVLESVATSRATGDFSPVALTWEMTRRCNFTCPFCYIRDNTRVSEEKLFSDFLVRSTLETIVEKGLVMATLTGGEPLLRSDFADVYRYLKEHGVLVTVFTNASVISDAILDLFADLPPMSCEVTLYTDDFASDPAINILRMMDIGVPVKVKFTVTRDNLDMFNHVKDWASLIGVPFMYDTELFDGDNGISVAGISAGYDDRVRLNAEKHAEVLACEREACGPLSMLPCAAAGRSAYLSPEFELGLCSTWKRRWSIEHAGYDVALSEMNATIGHLRTQRLKGCHGCKDRFLCHMCIARADDARGGFCVPIGHCEGIARFVSDMETALSVTLAKQAEG